MSVALPVVAFAAAFSLDIVSSMTDAQAAIYTRAGGVAEMTLSLIRTVTAFHGQRKMMSFYKDQLKVAEARGVRVGIMQGFAQGTILCVTGAAISIGMYAGSIWVLEGYERRCWESNPPFGDCRTGGSMLASMFTV